MRQRAARAGSWLASHPVEVVFALLLIVAFAYELRITRGAYFFWDEWNLINQGGSLGGMFDPFHQALGFVIILHYRVLTELFGFDYTPVRVVALIGFVSVSAAYFLTTRRQFGAPLAALLALPLLWVGRYVSTSPNELNHQLALLGAIVCAAALNRGRRADWLLAAALAFALLSAGGGLAAAAACLVHNACTRAHLRRWLAVLAPTLLWGVWYLSFLGKVDLGPNAMSSAQALRFLRDLSYTPFDSVALGVTAIGVVLAVAFVAYAIWALTRGLDHGANVLAWSMGLVAWGVGLVNSRGLLADTVTFRYRYFALGMVLLAVVPRRPIVWPARFPITTGGRWSLAASGVILVLGVGRGMAMRGDLQASAADWNQVGRVTRGGADRRTPTDRRTLDKAAALRARMEAAAERAVPFRALREPLLDRPRGRRSAPRRPGNTHHPGSRQPRHRLHTAHEAGRVRAAGAESGQVRRTPHVDPVLVVAAEVVLGRCPPFRRRLGATEGGGPRRGAGAQLPGRCLDPAVGCAC